ncbi:MAG: hypothetical protein OXF07_15585 [Rhodobacter sp.]|nr:hypothetical protein [Rhodobacter sp.]
MRRLATLLAAALAATVVAAPVAAQTTINAPGLIGPTACAGQGEAVDTNLGTITTVNNTSAVFTAPRIANMYSILRSRGGDGGPTEFPTNIKVYNAKNGTQAGSTQVIANFRSVYTELNTAFTFTLSSLTEKTPYYAVVYTTARGYGEGNPLTVRCFMTGGTYTPSNESGQPGYVANTTSGCFSISPRTHQDVRNCLCGRSRIWNDDAQNTAARTGLGCANQ